MAVGDTNDVIGRLQRWLPTRWFPSDAGTRVYATLAGFASPLSAIFSQITYVRNQARLGTVTDGFADLASYEYLGDQLPRLAGESDAAYVARIKANIFLDANTPAAIKAAVENVTGYPARVIEPWDPAQTFCWGKSFWGVNTAVNPGQWSNGDDRYTGFVVCSLPASGQSTGPRFGWGNFFWARGQTYAQDSGSWWTAFSGAAAFNLIYDAINRLKVKATSIWVQIVPPGTL